MSAFRVVVEIALELGGTCAGEHGVGTLKLPLLAQEQSDRVVELQRAVKRVFDPGGVLNPGKGIA